MKKLSIVFFIFGNISWLGSSEQSLDSLLEQGTSSGANQQASQEQDQEEQNDIQGLNFIQSFYGNPKYQSAMKILNDASLRSQYEQALNDYQLDFFTYTNSVLSNYHTPQTPAAQAAASSNQVSLNAFLNSVKHKNQPATSGQTSTNLPKTQANKTPQAVSGSANSGSDSVNSFLNSLKG